MFDFIEMKKLIQSNDETVKRMEVEMKVALRDLTSAKHELSAAEEKFKKMSKETVQVIRILELKVGELENKVLEKQGENEKLKLRVEEYKKNWGHVQHEMEAKERNSNQTVEKYEELVANQRNELERAQKEVKKDCVK